MFASEPHTFRLSGASFTNNVKLYKIEQNMKQREGKRVENLGSSVRFSLNFKPLELYFIFLLS